MARLIINHCVYGTKYNPLCKIIPRTFICNNTLYKILPTGGCHVLFQISIILSGSISLKSIRFIPVLSSAFFIRSFLLSLANFTCFLCCQYGCSSIFSKCQHCLFRQALPRICLAVSPHWCSLHTAQQFSDSQWNNVVMLLLLSCRFVLPWVFVFLCVYSRFPAEIQPEIKEFSKLTHSSISSTPSILIHFLETG